MKWIKRKANKEWTCILCKETIPVGEEFIRRPSLERDKPVSPPHKTTWEQWPTAFHEDCFKNLRRHFESAVPVYGYKDYEWKEVPDC